MAFEKFVAWFGAPRKSTAVDLSRLGLEHSAGLKRFVSDVGGGVFADGFLSVGSVREVVPNLGGWERWLPPGCRLFGCSAFGFLMFTRGEDVWIVDTQYGQVVESGLSIEETLDEIAEPEAREENHESLFKAWNQLAGSLPDTCVLSPTPAIALAGHWSVEEC
jgi:hypothetical protein